MLNIPTHPAPEGRTGKQMRVGTKVVVVSLACPFYGRAGKIVALTGNVATVKLPEAGISLCFDLDEIATGTEPLPTAR